MNNINNNINDNITLKQSLKIKIENNRRHIDFIVGRGRDEPKNYLNIPLNNVFNDRNIIFIDPNDVMNADVKQNVQDVDYSHFGICKNQDVNEDIVVRFIFDWSCFHCSALYNLTRMIKNIGRKCVILVPLDKNENSMPSDIRSTLTDPVFTLSLVEGFYPLFDWNSKNLNYSYIHKFDPTCKDISCFVNPKKYIKICAYYY